MIAAWRLARALADPGSVQALDVAGWTALIAAARAERLLGSLAWRLDGLDVPPQVACILAEARADAEVGRAAALWEAEMARRVLAPLGLPVILLKGTAFVAAGLAAGAGRSIGDLDILLPHHRLGEAEAALLAGGWQPLKEDAYDDAYYRRWMHELPPLVRTESGRLIDVHHTILPPTARPTPDAALMLADAVPLGGGLWTLSHEDMVIHAAAHLLADGDLAGGLRNLWDIDRLCREFGHEDRCFLPRLVERSRKHELLGPVRRALRLAHRLFDTPIDVVEVSGAPLAAELRGDRLFIRRLLARDEWGRERRPLTRLVFYIRSHWLRMPPLLLARHLWIKARRR